MSFTALLLVTPYGCSKAEKEAAAPAEQQQQQQQTADPSDPAKAHFEKGVQHLLKKEYDLAIKEYETVLQYNPKSAETYNNLGFAYFDTGEFEKASEAQKKAVEIKPDMANAYYGLAMAQEKTGDLVGALESWKAFSGLTQPNSKWWAKAQERIQVLENYKSAHGQDAGKPAGH
ncbi:MAG: tetratricopeptide repeat protein [Deltaproteobacteria bacterium]|nr:tetratricopeptide repeat protein [Deltaproteobacteria bacterium]